jgi:hypothetical protein
MHAGVVAMFWLGFHHVLAPNYNAACWCYLASFDGTCADTIGFSHDVGHVHCQDKSDSF